MRSILLSVKCGEALGFQGLSFAPDTIAAKLDEIFEDFELLETDAYSKRINWAIEQQSVSNRIYSDDFLKNIISECELCLPAKSFRIPISTSEYLEGTIWPVGIRFQSRNIEIPDHLVSKIRQFLEGFSLNLEEFGNKGVGAN